MNKGPETKYTPSGERRRSLRIAILIPFGVVVILMAAIAATIIPTFYQKNLEQETVIRSRLIAHAVQFSAETTRNLRELHRFVTIIGAEPNVDEIHLAADGRILASTTLSDNGRLVTELDEDIRNELLNIEDGLIESYEFHHDKNIMFYHAHTLLIDGSDAYFLMTVDTRAISEAIVSSTITIVTFGAMGLILLSAALYFFVETSVLKPLSRVANGIVRQKEKPEVLEHLSDRRDEIGNLANEFRNIINSLEWQRTLSEQSEARFKRVLDDQQETLCRFNANMTINFANKAFCHFIGASEEDIIQSSLLQILPAEHQAELITTMAHLKGSETTQFEIPFTSQMDHNAGYCGASVLSGRMTSLNTKPSAWTLPIND